jgi:hypothetical protein
MQWSPGLTKSLVSLDGAASGLPPSRSIPHPENPSPDYSEAIEIFHECAELEDPEQLKGN